MRFPVNGLLLAGAACGLFLNVAARATTSSSLISKDTTSGNKALRSFGRHRPRVDIPIPHVEPDPIVEPEPSEGVPGVSSGDGFGSDVPGGTAAGGIGSTTAGDLEMQQDAIIDTLTQDEAQGRGTILRESKAADNTYGALDNGYVTDTNPDFEVPEKIQSNWAAPFEQIGLKDDLEQGWNGAQIVAKQASGTGPVLDILHVDAWPYMAIVRNAAKDTDENDEAVKLPQSEIMYQWLRQATSATDDNPIIGLSYVAQDDILNADTAGFIRSAISEIQPGAQYLKITEQSNQKWFDTLLGSDNGRPTQYMLNDHPTSFSGDTVVAIHVWPTGTVSPINHAGNPLMVLQIGDRS